MCREVRHVGMLVNVFRLRGYLKLGRGTAWIALGTNRVLQVEHFRAIFGKGVRSRIVSKVSRNISSD